MHDGSGRRHFLSSMLMGLGLCSVVGCGGASDGLSRSAVSGKVTLDGKPLESGSISFDSEAGTKDPVSVGAVISAGTYSIDAASGPTPGTYRVAIMASDSPAIVDPSAAPGATPKVKKAKPTIPAKYNSKTELKRDVTAGASHSFDFELSTN